MLRVLVSTARKYQWVLVLAVFFSARAYAADSSLYNLEQGFNGLIYDLSRSVVTVESWQRASGNSVAIDGEEVLNHSISSGLICDTLGHILVAAPMVVGHDQVMVDFDRKLLPARLLGVDYFTNLALIQVDSRIGVPVKIAEQQICAGQMVLTLGNAYGMRASPSIGFCAGARGDGNIQFTTPVTSGSIGGGVFDLRGKLLGIVVGAVGPDNQVSQAVPGYRLPDIVDYILAHGDRQAGYLGITTAEIMITPGIEIDPPAGMLQVDSNPRRVIESGVIITRVVPQSPAERAGLKVGDLIFGFNGAPVSSARTLARQVMQTPPGNAVSIELLRKNIYYDLQAAVGARSLASFGDDVSDGTDAVASGTVVDSLSRAITSLKEQLQVLENRLNEVKH